MSVTTLAREIRGLIEGLRVLPRTADIIAEKVVSKPWARIGVHAGDVLLLLPPAEGHLPKNVELERLSVRFNIDCIVEQKGKRRNESLVIARMLAPSPATLDAFIDIVAVVLCRLRAYEPRSVSSSILTLAELFESLNEPPSTTLHGLFGELVVIGDSSDIDLAAASWHATQTDLHDFSHGTVRIEVKATCGQRQHIFSYEQLRPVRGISVVIASVLLESHPKGDTIPELLDRICGRLRSPEVAACVTRQAVRCLGDGWHAASEARFALAGGRRAVRFYAAKDVPCVKPPPFGVSQVKFKADLQMVPASNTTRLRALGPLAKAVIQPSSLELVP